MELGRYGWEEGEDFGSQAARLGVAARCEAQRCAPQLGRRVRGPAGIAASMAESHEESEDLAPALR